MTESRTFSIRLTPAQLDQIDAAARASGESRSAYIVRCALAGAGDSGLTRSQQRRVIAAVTGAVEGL